MGACTLYSRLRNNIKGIETNHKLYRQYILVQKNRCLWIEENGYKPIDYIRRSLSHKFCSDPSAYAETFSYHISRLYVILCIICTKTDYGLIVLFLLIWEV